MMAREVFKNSRLGLLAVFLAVLASCCHVVELADDSSEGNTNSMQEPVGQNSGEVETSSGKSAVRSMMSLLKGKSKVIANSMPKLKKLGSNLTRSKSRLQRPDEPLAVPPSDGENSMVLQQSESGGGSPPAPNSSTPGDEGSEPPKSSESGDELTPEPHSSRPSESRGSDDENLLAHDSKGTAPIIEFPTADDTAAQQEEPRLEDAKMAGKVLFVHSTVLSKKEVLRNIDILQRFSGEKDTPPIDLDMLRAFSKPSKEKCHDLTYMRALKDVWIEVVKNGECPALLQYMEKAWRGQRKLCRSTSSAQGNYHHGQGNFPQWDQISDIQPSQPGQGFNREWSAGIHRVGSSDYMNDYLQSGEMDQQWWDQHGYDPNWGSATPQAEEW